MNRRLERNEAAKQGRNQKEAFCQAKGFEFWLESPGSPLRVCMQVRDVQGELTAASTPLLRGEKWAAMLPSSCLKGKGLIYLLGEIRREQTRVAIADMGSPGTIPTPYLHFLSFCRRPRSDYRVL